MSVVEPPNLTSFPPAEPPRRRPRLKKLRLVLILAGLATLGLVSTVFGMMMAVSSDLPAIENLRQYQDARNSTLWDARGRRIGLLVSNENRVLVPYEDISPDMIHAIIAVEDKRFYTNSGVDLRGIGRAFVNDVIKNRPTQGGSTITQQLVKVAMQAQDKRTVFNKLREAALAYHLTRKWSKEKILTEYLNAIYFGNGAYGIEAAARTYFGADHPGCGEPGKPTCASELTPVQSALIAGVVASPTAFDPLNHPEAAKRRRDLVLRNMLDQGYLTQADYDAGIVESLPLPSPPYNETPAPYFTTWVRQQLVDRYGPQRAFERGLKVTTTLDLDVQEAAQDAVAEMLPDPNGPAAALVAIDNDSGEVRAMVGGRAVNGKDFASSPFNLATQGERQPGSAFKPFVFAAALRKGIAPGSVWPSRKKVYKLAGGERFTVNNYEGEYVGQTTLANATITSDNSVYAAVGFATGFRNIAKMATAMGIRTPVSTNPAIALGGLGGKGVTVLDMAHAYETLAQGGLRINGSLGAPKGGPVGIRRVQAPNGKDRSGSTTYTTVSTNKTQRKRVVSKKLADTAVPILRNVVRFGTGKAAAIPNVIVAGKTGTTENYGDAWFVGFTDTMTVAVWVGHPNSTKPMKTEFRGKPVAGGTFPAMIWRAFVNDALTIQRDRLERQRRLIEQRRADRAAKRAARDGTDTTSTSTTAPDADAGADADTRTGTTGDTPTGTATLPSQTTPAQQTPTPTTPAPVTPTPTTGGGSGGAAVP